jgi:ATP-dependent protease HslVU (ClpYQ) peptidase subunit
VSIIAAATDGTTVWMGSDSAVTGGITYLTGSKVFTVGTVLYGVCGNLDACNAIRHGSKLPGSVVNARSGGGVIESVELDRWAYHTILPRLKEAMLKNGVTEPSFNVMVGIRGRILLVDENAVSEDRRPYVALGSGSEVALGAMHTLMNRQGRRNHAGIVEKALEAACEFMPSCAGPLFIRNV